MKRVGGDKCYAWRCVTGNLFLSSRSPMFLLTLLLLKQLTDSMRYQRSDSLSTLIRRGPVSYDTPHRLITRACGEMMHVQGARISSNPYWPYCACINLRRFYRRGRRSAPDYDACTSQSTAMPQIRAIYLTVTHAHLRCAASPSIISFPFSGCQFLLQCHS